MFGSILVRYPVTFTIIYEHPGLMGGYSSIPSINSNTIGILYEGSQAQMTFESIGLEELRIKDVETPD